MLVSSSPIHNTYYSSLPALLKDSQNQGIKTNANEEKRLKVKEIAERMGFDGEQRICARMHEADEWRIREVIYLLCII